MTDSQQTLRLKLTEQILRMNSEVSRDFLNTLTIPELEELNRKQLEEIEKGQK